MKYSIRTTEEYKEWLKMQPEKEKAQIAKRISLIENDGHFGDDKDLREGLSELRWKNGRRVYFTVVVDDEGNTVVLLLGGNKNGQSKDITKARKIQRAIGAAG